MRFLKVILPLLILATLSGCSSRKGFQANDLSYVYDTKNLALRPDYYIYHINDSISRVYYRLNSNHLLYMRNSISEAYNASFQVRYYLVPSFENTTVLDSGVFVINDSEEKPPQKSITGNFQFRTYPYTDERQYVLRVVLTDRNRGISFENFLRLEKSDEHHAQNFLLTDTAGNILFKNHVSTQAPFYLSHNKLNSQKYYISYYRRDFPVSLPPYSSVNSESFDLKPDTTFMVNADQPFNLLNNGFYHFRLDTSQWSGFTVFSFYDEFPYVAKREHLSPPLRYLTTKREYENLMEAKGDPVETKSRVDDFWLNRAGSIERSRLLIKSYYGRIQEANIFFSSYIEGWKTDRGIIYTIYGPPDRVYRSSNGEAWVYGEEASDLSYYFSFEKVKNPFSDNDFMLHRMNNYRYGWGQAIDAWRNGRIYNSKDIQREQENLDQFNRQRAPYWY